MNNAGSLAESLPLAYNPASMSKGTRILIAAALLAILGYIVYSSMALDQYSCEVCMEFRGRTDCRKAVGATEAEATANGPGHRLRPALLRHDRHHRLFPNPSKKRCLRKTVDSGSHRGRPGGQAPTPPPACAPFPLC